MSAQHGTEKAAHTPGWPCGGRIVCPACAATRVLPPGKRDDQ